MPESINQQIEDALLAFGDLRHRSGEHILEGVIQVGEDDNYELRIDFSNFPDVFPSVWETGDRIPKKARRHVYENSKTCCFTTKAKASILLKTEISNLKEFIQKIVVPYLQNNTFYEINGHYATEEHSHDSSGIIEGYTDILKIQSVSRIALIMLERIQGVKIRPNDNCYCGGQMKLKKCTNGTHQRCYTQFKLIPREILRLDILYFRKA